MGIYDREYFREPSRAPWSNIRFWTITTWLIVINIAIFVIDQLSGRFTGTLQLTDIGYFSYNSAIAHLQIWRFFTFQFLHAGIGHIFWNMLGLYFFGPIVESQLGRRRYLAFYLLCGMGGPLGYLFLYWLHLLNVGQNDMLMGASAGIFGILVAGAKVAPNLPMAIAFTPFRISLKNIALIFLGIAAFIVLMYGGSGAHNAGGEAAHLGGALVGLILIFNERWLDIFYLHRPRMRYGSRRAAFRDWRKDTNH
ncbi:MAG TPA: rhomboid family intramembrane serine protease [Tepidisphaeraceae bacterium]|nr:rhomboid family intramembrane serine protease [Tepidisphaeraceae bacterium]